MPDFNEANTLPPETVISIDPEALEERIQRLMGLGREIGALRYRGDWGRQPFRSTLTHDSQGPCAIGMWVANTELVATASCLEQLVCQSRIYLEKVKETFLLSQS